MGQFVAFSGVAVASTLLLGGAALLAIPKIAAFKVALETLDMLDIAPDHRHLLLNRADDAVGLGPDKVESILGVPIAKSITTSIDIAAATNAGKPILVSNPKHPSSRAMTELAGMVTGEPVAPSFDGDKSDDRSNGAESDKAKSGSRFRIRR